MTWRELAAVAPLLAAIVLLGVYPKPFLDRVTPSVDHLLSHVQAVDPAAHVPGVGLPPPRYGVPPSQAVKSVAVSGPGRGSGRGGGG